MIRTSLFLPEPLYYRLHLLSKRNKRPFSQLARELFLKALADEGDTHLLRPYRALDTLDGRGDPAVHDASTTINDLLYGEQGAWKGRDDQ